MRVCARHCMEVDPSPVAKRFPNMVVRRAVSTKHVKIVENDHSMSACTTLQVLRPRLSSSSQLSHRSCGSCLSSCAALPGALHSTQNTSAVSLVVSLIATSPDERLKCCRSECHLQKHCCSTPLQFDFRCSTVSMYLVRSKHLPIHVVRRLCQDITEGHRQRDLRDRFLASCHHMYFACYFQSFVNAFRCRAVGNDVIHVLLLKSDVSIQCVNSFHCICSACRFVILVSEL